MTELQVEGLLRRILLPRGKIVVYIVPEVQEVTGYGERDIGTSLSRIHDRPPGKRPITTVKRVELLVVGQKLHAGR